MCIAEQPPTQLQKPQTPIPFLSSGWYISSIVSILWVSFEFHIFVGLPYKQTCIIKLGFFFPPVNLSFITVGGGHSAKNLEIQRENYFSPLHFLYKLPRCIQELENINSITIIKIVKWHQEGNFFLAKNNTFTHTEGWRERERDTDKGGREEGRGSQIQIAHNEVNNFPYISSVEY